MEVPLVDKVWVRKYAFDGEGRYRVITLGLSQVFLSFQKKEKEVLLILCMLLKFYVSVNNQEKRFNGERLKMLFFIMNFCT